MKNPRAVQALADFFGVEVEDLSQFHCPYCQGQGERKVQMGRFHSCDLCQGSGFSPSAFAMRAAEMLNDPEFGGDLPLVTDYPANPDVMLVDVLGGDWHGKLQEVASENYRTPLKQIFYWIKQGV